MIKVAIVGTSDQIMERYGTWSEMDSVKVTAVVVKDDQEQYLSAAVKERCVHRLEDLREAEIDLLDVCVLLNERASYIKQAAQYNMNVICDFPVALSAEETTSVVAECQKYNVRFFPGNSLRFIPVYADTKRQVKEGYIGHPGVMRVISDGKNSGEISNIFAELGLREIDWLLWTFGNVDRVMAKRVKKENGSGIPVDYAVAMFRMQDQSIVHMELVLSNQDQVSSFELTGDKGMLTYDSKESEPISIYSFTSTAVTVSNESSLAKSILKHQLSHFVVCMVSDESPLLTSDDVVLAMNVVAAAQESAETGMPVYVERGDFE